MNIDQITEIIIGCAYKVHNTLGEGFLEKVYENALCIELNDANLRVKQQVPVKVFYRDRVVGDYLADLVVEECIIIEIKAIRSIAKEHEVQLVNYLNATGIENGLLLNFGPSVEVKRKFREYKKPKMNVSENCES